MPLPKGEGRVNLIFLSLSWWERGEGLISLHRAGEGGSSPARDILMPTTSEFGLKRAGGRGKYQDEQAAKLLGENLCFFSGLGLELHQGAVSSRLRTECLRQAPVIQHGHLLDAGDGAKGSARLTGIEFPPQVLARIVFQGDGRVATLL